MIPHCIRAPEGDDASFLLHSWLSSYLDWLQPSSLGMHPEYDRLAKAAYFAEYKPRFVALLKASRVVVACAEDDPWQILGWLASEGSTLHYCYVKRPFRRQGLACALWNEAGRPMLVTHGGRAFAAIAERHGLRACAH